LKTKRKKQNKNQRDISLFLFFFSFSLALRSVGWFVGTAHDSGNNQAISMHDGGRLFR
jgi:hypothetical protein